LVTFASRESTRDECTGLPGRSLLGNEPKECVRLAIVDNGEVDLGIIGQWAYDLNL